MPRRERPLDPGDSPLLGFARDLRLLREKAGSPTYRKLGRLAHFSAATLSDAAAGRKLPTLAVTLAYVQACDGDLAEWEERWHAVNAATAPTEAPEVEDQDPPYVGLAAFQPEDAQRFFGRDRLVRQLLNRISDRRVVAVFGASGAGKSSLLRAGLLATVRGAESSNGRSWRTMLFTPGTHPMEECAIQLAGLTTSTPEALRAELSADPRSLHRLVRRLLVEHPPHTELLLVVDQFEEVFTLCHDHHERARFIDTLITAAQADNSRCRLVLGVRADFYAHCTTHPELIEAVGDAQLAVCPMTADELRQAITQPAVHTGCTVETALVSRMVADATGQPGVLPLVSHALLETWRRRRGNTLTLTGYEAAGGIERAVTNTAEQAYTALAAGQQRLAKQVVLRLTALGEGTEDTKRRVHRTELDTDNPDTTTVLEHLTRARLLTVDHGSIEISHEALIRCWPRLRGWLTEDRAGLRIHRQLTNATDAWAALHHDPGSLYRGARLALTQDWAGRNPDALSSREHEFLTASLHAQAREQATARRRVRRLRQLVALLTVLFTTSAAATGYAVHAQNTATEQRNTVLSQKVAAQATELRAVNPSLAAQLSLASYQLVPTVEARSSLLSAFATPFATQLSHEINTVAFAPDGRILATGGDDRTVRLWDVSTVHQPAILTVLPGQPEDVESLVFSPDGRTLVSGNYDGTVRIWNVAEVGNPALLAEFAAHADPVFRAALSPDARTLATASSDHTVRLWDVSQPAQPAQPVRLAELTGHTGVVWTAVFSPDGQTLATASEDQTARLWDIADRRDPQPLSQLSGYGESVNSVAFSPDGRVLATAGFDHIARLWDVTDPQHPAVFGSLVGHTAPLQAVAFSPDRRTVATAGWDHTVRVWNAENPGHTLVLTGHTNTVWSLTFSPDGRTLASASSDRTALLTDVPGSILAGQTGASWTAVFSPDGRTVAIGSEDYLIRLWDVSELRHPRPLAVLDGHTGQIKSVAFSPDGHILAVGSIDNTVSLWDVTDPSRPQRLPTLTDHTRSVRSAVFSPDGKTLASAGDDHTVRLWDLTDPRRPSPLGSLDADGDVAIAATAFSPDGRTLAGTMTDKVRLWDVSDPRRPTLLADVSGHTDAVQSVAFSPDGHRLATAGFDRTARLWDITDPRQPAPLGTLTGHTDAVQSVAFSPDGHRLATAGFDRTARLWDITDPRQSTPLGTLNGHINRVYSVAFSRDGRNLVTSSEDHTVRLWEVDVEQVVTRVCELAYPPITRTEWDQYFPSLAYQPPCP